MSDIEFDILDELYFVTHYKELAENLSYDAAELKESLHALISKGWVKCFSEPDEEVYDALPTFETHYNKYLYLATKEGLKAHTSL